MVRHRYWSKRHRKWMAWHEGPYTQEELDDFYRRISGGIVQMTVPRPKARKRARKAAPAKPAVRLGAEWRKRWRATLRAHYAKYPEDA